MARKIGFCLALCMGLVCMRGAVRAEDWPQWMGPTRDGTWRETGIVREFPESGPDYRWRVDVAMGYSGPAVAEGHVYVTDYVRTAGEATNNPGTRDKLMGQERVTCFSAATGEVLWRHAYDCPYQLSYPGGPRCTPTVQDGKVYTLGAEGDLLCLDAKQGTLLWSKNLKQEYQVESPVWGFCAHPLVEGNKLIGVVGGAGSVAVAWDKESGQELWRSLTAEAPGYCPPTMIEAAGKRQLLIWHAEALNALDPETGTVFWSQPLQPSFGMSITAPRKYGDLLFAGGIGSVAAAFKLASDRTEATVAWRGGPTTAVYCANSTPVIKDGVIYGCDCQDGALRAVNLETGERLWSTFDLTPGKRRLSQATTYLVDNGDCFFLMSETGDLVIARLSPEKYEELSRCLLIEPTGSTNGRAVAWSHPAFAERCVFARNDKELVCVSLSTKKE